VSRAVAGAVIEDPRIVAERAVTMVKERRVKAIHGKMVDLGNVHTICVHGDNLKAVSLVKAIRKELNEADVEVAAVGKFL
jgi:UPF0271 protein